MLYIHLLDEKSSWFQKPKRPQMLLNCQFCYKSQTDRQTDRLQISPGLWHHNLQAKKKCHGCDLQGVGSYWPYTQEMDFKRPEHER